MATGFCRAPFIQKRGNGLSVTHCPRTQDLLCQNQGSPGQTGGRATYGAMEKDPPSLSLAHGSGQAAC